MDIEAQEERKMTGDTYSLSKSLHCLYPVMYKPLSGEVCRSRYIIKLSGV